MCEVEANKEEENPDVEIRNPGDVLRENVYNDRGKQNASEDVDGCT